MWKYVIFKSDHVIDGQSIYNHVQKHIYGRNVSKKENKGHISTVNVNENPITDPSVGPSRSTRRTKGVRVTFALNRRHKSIFQQSGTAKKKKEKKNFPFDVY